MAGLKPLPYLDHRNYSFHRTFGAVSPDNLPTDLDLDAGLTMPDQNFPDPAWGNPAFPNGCTAFTQTDIATDEDKILYNPKFTYDKTLFEEDQQEGVGCTIIDSLNSGVIYGMQAKGETDAQALTHRRSPYFQIRPHDSYDYFDAVRSAFAVAKKSASTGTPWVGEFAWVGADGLEHIVLDVNGRYGDWHNWKACGVKTVNGVPYIKGKVWCGNRIGDNGWTYWPREVFNAMCAVPGAGVFMNHDATGKDIQTIEVTILQFVISLLNRLIRK